MTRRSYAGGAKSAFLLTGIGSGDLSATISDATGWPNTATGECVVTFDRGNAGEERALATRSGTVLTFASLAKRGVDGTSSVAHAAGVTVEHTFSGLDADDANGHLNGDPATHLSLIVVGDLTANVVKDSAGTGAYLVMNPAGVNAGEVLVQTRSATNVGLAVRGAVGQSFQLQRWEDSSGAALLHVNSAGDLVGASTGTIAIGNIADASVTGATFQMNPAGFNAGEVILFTRASANNGLAIRGAASQVGDLQRWENSSGSALGAVGAAGQLTFTDPSVGLRTAVFGAADSAGAGFRTVRVSN